MEGIRNSNHFNCIIIHVDDNIEKRSSGNAAWLKPNPSCLHSFSRVRAACCLCWCNSYPLNERLRRVWCLSAKRTKHPCRACALDCPRKHSSKKSARRLLLAPAGGLIDGPLPYTCCLWPTRDQRANRASDFLFFSCPAIPFPLL